MSPWVQYLIFLLKSVTAAVVILFVAAGFFTLLRKAKEHPKQKLNIRPLNKTYDGFAEVLNKELMTQAEYKKYRKSEKKRQKEAPNQATKRLFVIDFQGDIRCSAVNNLREIITAILQVAQPQDEVLLKLESGGGMIAPYGLAASQLERLKQQSIPLTVAIDKVAASGGYLMACVADQILAAPFAIIGSIGVVAQLPNFHRFLKKRDIDFELVTAGPYKRTLTLFGENTAKAREKMQAELEEVHRIFKTFITQHRQQVDIERVATGEHWLASEALTQHLVDRLITSDDYLLRCAKEAVAMYEVSYTSKKSLSEKLSEKLSHLSSQVQNLY